MPECIRGVRAFFCVFGAGTTSEAARIQHLRSTYA
jgi:hypothetical protein